MDDGLLFGETIERNSNFTQPAQWGVSRRESVGTSGAADARGTRFASIVASSPRGGSSEVSIGGFGYGDLD